MQESAVLSSLNPTMDGINSYAGMSTDLSRVKTENLHT